MARSASGYSQPATGSSGSAPLKVGVAAAIAMLAPAPACALFQDHLEIWATENLTHDSNVFRVSDRLPPTVIGSLKLSDTISTTHLGASVDAPFSQQRVQASFDAYTSRYRRLKDLNNDGHTARVQLVWGLIHRLNGTLGYTEGKGLASFANIQNTTPDIVSARQTWLTANWSINPSLRASGGFAAAQNKHSDIARRLNDIETTTIDAGLAYLTPDADSVALVARAEKGRLPRAATIAGLTFNNNYNQYGSGVSVAWIANGLSRLDGRLEWVRRTYEEATQRNYGGPIGRLLYTWTPTGKLTVVAAALRDFGAPEEINSSFVLVKGSYIRPQWTVTEKITIQGNLEYNVTYYRGDPVTGFSYTHHERLYGASITYRPLRKIMLSAGVNRDTRFSTLPLGDFDVLVAFIEGRAAF
jgi:exopolysaccharide biosynthesis operon protein EpsL